MSFTHLHVHSNFSCYDGAVSVTELVERATQLGMGQLALTDHNSLAGAVRFFKACEKAGVRPIIGVEFTIEAYTADLPPTHLVLLAKGGEGYRSLCRLVTCAQLGQAGLRETYQAVDRKHPILAQEALQQHACDLIALSGCAHGELPQLLHLGDCPQAERVAHYYRNLFGPDNYFIELQHQLLPLPGGRARYRLLELAQRLRLPVVATNNVHYATKSHAPLQDALTCLRYGQRVHEQHPDRKRNWEYTLKSSDEMARLFDDIPAAIAATDEIADRCQWQFEFGRPHFPRLDPTTLSWPGTLPPSTGEKTQSYLRRLCEQALPERYAAADQDEACRQMEHELAIVADKGLADYFLIVWDIVQFARSRDIRCTGRGSAADSLLCYLLGITQVEPLCNDLLFERFLSPARVDLPDIDLDFDSSRRDEVVGYAYRRYGQDRVAAVATVNTFRARAAIRELGKVLDYPDAEVSAFAEVFGYVSLSDLDGSLQRLPEVRNSRLPLDNKRLLLRLCEQVSGYPRHLAVHVGGLIICPGSLTDYVPLQLAAKGIVVCQYDKDDLEALGLLKMDLLGLRTHTALAHCLTLLEQQGRPLELEQIPLDDPATYRLLCAAQTIGLFQLESPGQRNLLGRTQPSEFEDVIANISLFRPGPVKGGMVQPYVLRRRGRQKVTYLHPALEAILQRTYGVIIYQEQVLRIAAEVGGVSLAEAEVLRRGMTFDASPAELLGMQTVFCEGALRRGLKSEVAEAIWQQLAGFAAYGFCKGHAASFGKMAYQTAYLKAHYPAEFIAGLLSAQPMGFYPSRTLAEEAKRLELSILPPCVNCSKERYTVERGSIRCSLAAVRGMTRPALESLLQARQRGGPFSDFEDFRRRVQVPAPTLRSLILAHAFDFANEPLYELIERLRALRDDEGEHTARRVSEPLLPLHGPQTAMNRLAWDLHLLGLSTGVHPFAPWAEEVIRRAVTPSSDLLACEQGQRVRVAGIVVARARPPTRSGKTAVFICLEDHTGLVDVAVFEEVYQRTGYILYTAAVLLVEGTLTRLGDTDLAVTAQQVWAMPLPAQHAGEKLPELPLSVGAGSHQ